VEPEQRTGVRFTVDVGPGDSGVRISLRRRLPEGGFGDVLGELLGWDEQVRVLRKDGTVVSVDPATVVAAKRVPPAPERRR
jgi:hypothetical protein